MFFNLFNKRMKKAYSVLDSQTKKLIFPNGENEFIYVATLLNNNLNYIGLDTLFPIYGSVKTFVSMEKGNYNYIYQYSKRKMNGYDEEEIYTMIAIAISTMIPGSNFNDASNNLMEKCKKIVKTELNTIQQINSHLDIFATKNDSKVGSIDNPILLPGVSGVEKYFNKLVTSDNKEIVFKRTNCMYLTDNKTNINYALDEYDIYYKDTNEKICSLFINEYGTSNCEYYPKGFKKKK